MSEVTPKYQVYNNKGNTTNNVERTKCINNVLLSIKATILYSCLGAFHSQITKKAERAFAINFIRIHSKERQGIANEAFHPLAL